MRNRESFNGAAALYDEVRPTYPDDMIDWIIVKSNVNDKDELLEIAPGTGQCTKKFAERDFMIHTVELGDKLAELLLHNMRGKKVTVDVSSFEDWVPLEQKKYKLIYCATAWHWIDPKIKYEKTYNLLEDDGMLAVIWNNALDVPKNEIMSKAFDALFSYHNETPHSTKPKAVEEIDTKSMSTKDMLEESGHYLFEDYYEKTWTMLQSKEITIKGFYSQSSYLSLSEKDKNELNKKLSVIFSDLDDLLEVSFKTVVYLLRKNL